MILCTVTYTGVVERLQIVIAHTNDQDSSIAEVNEENRKLRKEIELMKSYIIRLERRLDSQREEILDLKSRSMRDNVMV